MSDIEKKINMCHCSTHSGRVFGPKRPDYRYFLYYRSLTRTILDFLVRRGTVSIIWPFWPDNESKKVSIFGSRPRQDKETSVYNLHLN